MKFTPDSTDTPEDPGKLKDVITWQEAENLLRRQAAVNDVLRTMGAPTEQIDDFMKMLGAAAVRLRDALNTPQAKEVEAKINALFKAFAANLIKLEQMLTNPWFKELLEVLQEESQLLAGTGISVPELEEERRRIEQAEKVSLSWRDFASRYNPATGRRKKSYLEKYVKAHRLAAIRKERLERQAEAKDAKLTEFDYYNMPTSQALTQISNMFAYSANLPLLKGRIESRDNRANVDLTDKGFKYTKVTSFNSHGHRGEKTAIVGVHMDKLNEIADDKRGGKSVERLFNYAMIKINEQAYSGGELTKDFITFPLQDLVGMDQYESVKSARQAVMRVLDLLSGIKVNMLTSTDKETRGTINIAPIFINTKLDIRTGECTLTLNRDNIPWPMLFEFFTILPSYYFRLSKRGSALLLRIFAQARQETDAIKTDGRFTITMKTVQTWLALRASKSAKWPRRDIVEAIEAAIDGISDKEKEAHGSEPQLLLTPKYSGDSVQDYMNGTLEIELRGKYKDCFIAQAQRKEKKVAAKKKRQERIEDAAKAKLLAAQQAAKNDS